MPMQYLAIFHGCKNDNFQMKNCDIFLIFVQNIDCGYTLEPQKLENNEYSCKPQFYYIKVGCKGYKSHGHVILMISKFVNNFKLQQGVQCKMVLVLNFFVF